MKDPLERGTKIMSDEQSVADMVDEVLARQAAYRASQTGESFEDALETVAGRQLQELRSGPHSHTRADEWQTIVARERAQALREARRKLAEHLAPLLRWR